MTTAKQLALILVREIVADKRGRHVAPDYALRDEVTAMLGRALDALASVHFLSKQYGGAPADKNISVDGPAGTVTCVDHHAFVAVHYGHGFNTSVDSPAATLTTKDRMALVSLSFLDMQYGNATPASVDTAAGAVTTNPKHHLVTVRQHYLMMARSSHRPAAPSTTPASP